MAIKKVPSFVTPASKPKTTKSSVDFLDDIAPLDEVERALSALPAEDTALYLYRVRTEGRPLFLAKLSPGQFNLSTVQERWGGGSYKIVSVDTVTDDRQEREFEISGLSKDGGPQVTAQVASAIPPLPPLPPGANAVEVRLDRLERMLFQFVNSQSSGLSEGLISKLIEGSNRSEDRILERLATYKSLFSPASASQSTLDVQTLVSMFQKGLEAANGEPASPWVTVIEKVLPYIQELTAKIPTRPGVPQRQAIPQGGQPTMPQITGFISSIEPMIRPHLGTFVVAAASDDDPGLLVPLVARRIPADHKEKALEWLRGPEWFKELCQLDPRISLQATWWNEFVLQLRAELGDTAAIQGEGEVEQL